MALDTWGVVTRWAMAASQDSPCPPSLLPAKTPERSLTAAAVSMEADIAFFDDPADVKADQFDGAIGELSMFHETFGYYAQGVSVSTAVLPEGWRDRIVAFATPGTTPGRGLCLDPHDWSSLNSSLGGRRTCPSPPPWSAKG